MLRGRWRAQIQVIWPGSCASALPESSNPESYGRSSAATGMGAVDGHLPSRWVVDECRDACRAIRSGFESGSVRAQMARKHRRRAVHRPRFPSLIPGMLGHPSSRVQDRLLQRFPGSTSKEQRICSRLTRWHSPACLARDRHEPSYVDQVSSAGLQALRAANLDN